MTGGADGRYVSTGHLVYARMGELMAVPFDSRRLVVTGARTVDGVAEGVNEDLSDMAYAGRTVHGLRYAALVYLTGGRGACG